MSRVARRAVPQRRCDCLACSSFRAARVLFLVGVAVFLMLAVILHAGEPKPLLLDDHAVQASAAATDTAPSIPADLPARAKFPKDNPQLVDILAAVNRFTNAAITPMSDEEHYGKVERFVAWPADGKGDCEDYALSKMELLGNMGFPLPGNAILLSVVVHRGGTPYGHAIVQLRLPSGAFMYLDSRFAEPMTRRELVAQGYHFFDWSDA
jgi:predicted transglutaminase-like cysteine proteinase